MPLVAPAGIVSVAGRLAALLLLLRAMTAPPAPAGAASVTVAVAGLPPVTEGGESTSPAMVLEAGAAGLIVSPAVAVVREDAVMVAVRCEETVFV